MNNFTFIFGMIISAIIFFMSIKKIGLDHDPTLLNKIKNKIIAVKGLKG